MEGLAATLFRLRKLRAKTLRQVEEVTGISNAYLSQLETGKADKPSPHVLHKLAECYEVPYEVLMEAAGYLEPKKGELPPAWVGIEEQLMSAGLTDDERELTMKFIKFLRSEREPNS
jgi:HTH-type transcriptional regulator, competence development regulator